MLMRSVLMTAASALATALVVAACGGGDDGPPGDGGTPTPTITVELTPGTTADPTSTPMPAVLRPCELVAAVDAEDVLGEPSGGPLFRSFEDYAGCRYEAEGGSAKALELQARRTTVERFQQQLETRENYEGFEEFSDLGDSAYYDPATGFLHVRAGDAELAVSVELPDGSTEEEVEVAKGLARVALGRLPEG
jgi:hypothetical protein